MSYLQESPVLMLEDLSEWLGILYGLETPRPAMAPSDLCHVECEHLVPKDMARLCQPNWGSGIKGYSCPGLSLTSSFCQTLSDWIRQKHSKSPNFCDRDASVSSMVPGTYPRVFAR